MYDVIIIGAGIIGTAIARELSKYQIKTIIVDKENDIANGTTKANSAIVHAGYDAKRGTLKAETNVAGNAMYEDLCNELGVPFRRIGSFVVGFNEEDMSTLNELYQEGVDNGVPNLKILNKKQVKEMEPNLSDEIMGALYAPSAGIVGPWELAIALAENAAENGVEILLNTSVTAIEKNEEGFLVTAGDQRLKTKYIINCAGLFADEINNMVNTPSFKILPHRGEYNLFDKSVGDYVKRVIFQTPTKHGKGVLVLPTVHGNLLIGPTSDFIDDPEATETTKEGLQSLKEKTNSVVPNFPFHTVITSFAGLRAKVATNDFFIEESKESKGFINVAAIDSPGLSAAPAIGEMVTKLLFGIAGGFDLNLSFNPTRRPNINFMVLSDEEKAELIQRDPRYGRVICRCESVTEGEIVDIINRKAGATNLDAIKRRARAGAGRCQGGFCGPRVMEILARELNVDITSIVKDSKESYILTGPTKSNKNQEHSSQLVAVSLDN
ncbi:NAD(P)/FAD-dependent oxidoreductase [Alkaliphilus hydrothermalis]|uniref:Glycerol-3-phosphate dehydrogenase n=1 Tax=Alkaliphilus hydrothermalis TaxID=1482730 RepID=A0ABS2NLG0_9FIRM|nr:NAD(P)/FAD-dependent oxidoreductase [Alkaliphilus hydrothermalis]MBM7613770.1 glycerol-3-phosphate dehydrogenase [Alkaliphilus hydrothermalis]